MTAVTLSTDRLGEVAATYDARICTQDVARYAAAIGHPDTAYGPGEWAPPLFGVVPTRRAVLAALRSVVPEEVGHHVPILHGEQDVVLRRPLRCEELVQVTSRPLGVRQKSSGCLVLLGIEISAGHETVERQRFVVFLPGASGAPDVGELPEPLPAVQPAGEVLRTPTFPEQSRLYAVASGDDTAFHVDDVAARGYGFPGVIMHGLCTLATVVADLAAALRCGPTDVRRVAARFSGPAFPGQDVLTTYAEAGASAEFTSADPEGRPLLTCGRVELS